jgi:acyl carrier protein
MTEHTDPLQLDRLSEIIEFSVRFLELDIDPAKAASESLADLGIDSLELLSLTGELEEAFGITFDPDRLQNAARASKPLTLGETLCLMASRG